jgi:DNA-binding NarL/FixJ family response regulator
MVAAESPVSELSVLVVEDSGIVRERLVRLLSAVPNLRVVGEAATATDAIEKIGQFRPDVVTLDLRLEQGTGLDVLRAVEAFDRRPCIAVLTNYGDQRSRSACFSLGADYVFDKSLELADLKTTLTALANAGGSDR